MTVTFAPAETESDLLGWNVTHFIDGDVDVVSGPYEDYHDAELALLEHNVRCSIEDCVYYGGSIGAELAGEMAQAPSLDVSNANAVLVLRALGLLPNGSAEQEWDLSGVCSAEDFLGRVLLASVLSPADEGVPAFDNSADGSARFIESGRRVGYLEDRLSSLRELAEFCCTYDREVTWA